MQVCVLGPVRIRDSDSVVEVRGRLQQRILARLAVNVHQLVSFEALEFAAWLDERPASARHTISTNVFRLRRLGVNIVRASDGYRLQDPTDVEQFDEWATAARVTRRGDPAASVRLLNEALELYRGPAFSDLEHVDMARYESIRISDLVESTREDLLELELELNDPPSSELISTAQQLTASEPYRERRWELLMSALYRAGRQADALDAYTEARRRLIDELGVEPGPSLRSMQQAVLAQDDRLERRRPIGGSADVDHPADSVRHRVPAPSTRLIGRTKEQHDVIQAWARTRLVTLLGPPGAGKTRVAVASVEDDEDRVWFVVLDQDTDSRSVSATILDVVAPASRASDALEGVIAQLSESSGTLVLDGCDARSDAAGRCAAAVLRGCPGVRILVTSRERLGLIEEAVIMVGPMPADDARTLLVDRARLRVPDFALARTDEAVADRLCELVDRLPLGIELISRHLQLMRLDEVITRVDADLGRWTRGEIGAPRGLWSALRAATDRLAPIERRTLAALAVIGVDASVARVRDVVDLDAEPIEIDDVFDVLARLVDHSLVSVSSGTGQTRFRLLHSVAAYTLETMTSVCEELRSRYHHVVLRALTQIAADFSDADRARMTSRMDDEIAQVRVVLSELITDPGDGVAALAALRLAVRLGDYWLGRHPAEGLNWLTGLLDVTEPDRGLLAETLLRCGHLAYWATDFDRGCLVLEQARPVFHSLGDALGEGRTLRRLGAIATARDDLEEGGRLIAESLACFEQAEAESEIGTTLLHLGSLLADQGLVDQALPVVERALLIARSGTDPLAVGHALAAMTLVRWKAGDMPGTIDSGEQALALFDRLGQHAAGGTVAYRLSAASRIIGDVRSARSYALLCTEAGVRTGTRTTVALGHLHQARLDLDVGEFAMAGAHLLLALDQIDPAADRWVLVELLEAVARLGSELSVADGTRLIESAAAIRLMIQQPVSSADRRDIQRVRDRASRFDDGARDDGSFVALVDAAAAHALAVVICREATDAAGRRSTVRRIRG